MSYVPSTQESDARVVRFPLGRVCVTRGVHELMQAGELDPIPLLERHARGDWGDLSSSDQQQNDKALQAGDRLFSSYDVAPRSRIWIITEWDRSVTTILLPSEY